MKCGMCQSNISLHPARKCRVKGCSSKTHRVPHVHCYPYNHTYCELDFGKDMVTIRMPCVFKVIGTDKVRSYKWLQRIMTRSFNTLMRRMVKLLNKKIKQMEK